MKNETTWEQIISDKRMRSGAQLPRQTADVGLLEYKTRPASLPQSEYVPSFIGTRVGEARQSAKHPTVLVVDGEAFSRNVFVRALSRFGYEVLEAADIGEATKIFRSASRPIDLLIAESKFRDGTGSELASQLRKHFPEAAVLFTSSLPEERACFHFADFETDFLPKPFPLSQLDEKVAHLLSEQPKPS